MGEDVTPEEPVADEATAGEKDIDADRDDARPRPNDAERSTDFAEPTEADFLEADAASERARLAAQRMSWRRRTATGAILSGLALGFQQVFEDNKQDVSVIVETSGEPPTDLPVEAELEGHAPRRSVVKIRPWLLGDGDATDPKDTDSQDDATDAPAGEATPPES